MPKHLKGLCADMDGIVQWNDCCCVSLVLSHSEWGIIKTRDIIASCFSRFKFCGCDVFLRVT